MSDFKRIYDRLRAQHNQLTLEEFARQVGVPLDGSSAAIERLREIASRGTIASLRSWFHPENFIIDHEPQRYALGVDLASGPDRTVIMVGRRNGRTYAFQGLMAQRAYIEREARRKVYEDLTYHPRRPRYITPQILRMFGFVVSEAPPRR